MDDQKTLLLKHYLYIVNIVKNSKYLEYIVKKLNRCSQLMDARCGRDEMVIQLLNGGIVQHPFKIAETRISCLP